MHFIYHRSLQIVTLLLVAVALVACGGGERESRKAAEERPAASTVQQSAAASEADTTVNVIASDFEFSLETNSANAGTISFVVSNEGSMPHDFAIAINGERHKTEMIMAGASSSLTVDLQPGSYEYICTVPGHDILGMKGTFTVE